MGRTMLFAAVLSGVVLLVAAGSRREATADAPLGEEPTAMPTSEAATEPLGSAPRWEPLTPYATGPEGDMVRYEELPFAEQAAIDGMRQVADAHQQVQSVYAAAAAERFNEAIALQAEHRLGLADLADVGVVAGTGDVPGGLGTPGAPPPSTGGGGGRGTGGGGGQGTGGGDRNGAGGGS